MGGSKSVGSWSLRFAAVLLAAFVVAGCGNKSENLEKLLTNAKQERAKGHYNSAIIYLKDLLQKSPKNAEARYLLGATYSDTGDFQSAESELRRALDLHYDPAKVMPRLGKAMIRTGAFQKVLDQIKPVANASSAVQAEILTLRALASLGLRHVDEGRTLLDQALKKKPGFPDALVAQARLAASQKKLDEAMRLVERALTGAPKDVDAWMLKGDLYRARANRTDAMTAYEKVLDLRPDNIPARLNIASLEIDAEHYGEAMKRVAQVRKLAPRSPIASYLQALVEFRQKKLSAARDTILKVLKVAPTHVPSLLLAGAIETALGSQAQAQAYLGEVIARVPDNLYARKLLAASLLKTGNVQHAIEVLQPALSEAPDDAGLMTLAGDAYMRDNEFAKATQYYQRGAKLDPKSAVARTGLGLSRMASGETDRALADLESASHLNAKDYRADIVLIMSLLHRSDFAQALKAVAELEKKQPKNPLTYNLKAAVYLGEKNPRAARKSLEYALKLQPTYVPAAVNLAQLDLQDKNPKAARHQLEVILKKDKNNVQALLALAALAPRLGATPKERIEWLQRAVQASPAAVRPKVLLARAYAQTGALQKALDTAQQAHEANPNNPDALDLLGTLQLRTGSVQQALSTFGKLVRLEPKSALALYRLSTAQVVAGDRQAAMESLKSALAIKADFVDAQVGLAELEAHAGNYSDAVKIARQLEKRAPKSPVGFGLEGDIWMVAKKFPEAVKAYESADAKAKSSRFAIKLHAALTRAGRAQEADARLLRRLKRSPNDLALHMYWAELNLKKGNYKTAIKEYEQLQRKLPNNLVVLNNLAWAYQQVKDPRALKTAEHAYKLKPENPAVADTLGWMLVEQGNTQRGVEMLEEAVAAAPKAQDIRFHLAKGLLKAGDKSKARRELERIKANGTEFPQKAEAMSLLKQLQN